VPAGLLNGGRYILGLNASAYRIKTFFHDEQALAFNVDPSGAPGTQWPEARLGPVRPSLEWEINKI
jgi:lipopolysaccharide transport system ATP-binding protein